MSKKKTIITIISVYLMLIMCIVYAMSIRTIAVAALGAKYMNTGKILTEDLLLSDSVYNKSIPIDLGIFSLIQIVSLAMYLLNKKNVLIGMLCLEIVLLIAGIIGAVTGSDWVTILYSMPLANISLYLIFYENKNKKRNK